MKVYTQHPKGDEEEEEEEKKRIHITMNEWKLNMSARGGRKSQQRISKE